MADWSAIKAEYITGDESYRKLAAKYAVPLKNLAYRAKAESWVEERERFRHKSLTNAMEAAQEARTDRVLRLQKAADDLLAAAEAALADKERLSGDTEAMRDVARVLKDIKDIQGIKSEADMREQEARIANLRRQAASDEKPAGITVEIAGGESTWGA